MKKTYAWFKSKIWCLSPLANLYLLQTETNDAMLLRSFYDVAGHGVQLFAQNSFNIIALWKKKIPINISDASSGCEARTLERMCTYVGIHWRALHRKVGITPDWITGQETRLACCRLLHLVPSYWGIISANQFLSYVETYWVLWRDNLWSTRSLMLIHWIAMKTVDIQFLNTTAIILSSVCMVSMENTNSETRFEKEAKGNSKMAYFLMHVRYVNACELSKVPCTTQV